MIFVVAKNGAMRANHFEISGTDNLQWLFVDGADVMMVDGKCIFAPL